MNIAMLMAFVKKYVDDKSSAEITLDPSWKWLARSQELSIKIAYVHAWTIGWMLASFVIGTVSEGLLLLSNVAEQLVNTHFVGTMFSSPLIAYMRFRYLSEPPGGIRIVTMGEFANDEGTMVRREQFELIPVVKAAAYSTIACGLVLAVPFFVWYLYLT